MIAAQGAQAGATAPDDDSVEHAVNHGSQKAQKRSRREPAKAAAARKRAAKQRTTAWQADRTHSDDA
jgi:hypothetical protein